MIATTLKMIRGRRGMLAAIAKELGVTRGAVAKWSRIPAGRVIAVERVTGISREELRPDLYPATASEREASSEEKAVG